MSLIDDLKAFVQSFRTTQDTKYTPAVNALLASVDVQAAMTLEAQAGKPFCILPFYLNVITGVYQTPADLKEIEDLLVLRLKALYPDIKFYRNKYTQMQIYAQWEEVDQRRPEGPVIG